MSDDHNMRKQPTNSTFGKGPTPTKSVILEMKMCSNQKVEENNSFKIKFYKRKELPVKDFEQNMCSPAFLPYPKFNILVTFKLWFRLFWKR